MQCLWYGDTSIVSITFPNSGGTNAKNYSHCGRIPKYIKDWNIGIFIQRFLHFALITSPFNLAIRDAWLLQRQLSFQGIGDNFICARKVWFVMLSSSKMQVITEIKFYKLWWPEKVHHFQKIFPPLDVENINSMLFCQIWFNNPLKAKIVKPNLLIFWAHKNKII